MQAEILNTDYNQLVRILGTTHFSRRSLQDAYRAVTQLKPTDLAIELDMKRYQILKTECAVCPQNENCSHKCEFIGAVEALKCRDANIWLIDMSKNEFIHRMHRPRSLNSHWQVLIDERDTLMAARLAWLTTEGLNKRETPVVLALVGAAHVKGIKSLLRNPTEIKNNLRWLGLSFTPPTLIRHIAIDRELN